MPVDLLMLLDFILSNAYSVVYFLLRLSLSLFLEQQLLIDDLLLVIFLIDCRISILVLACRGIFTLEGICGRIIMVVGI